MIKKTLLYSLLIIASIFLLVPLTSAFTEDFTVNGLSEINVYDCVSSEAGIITVTNIGNVPSGYSLSVSGSAANFVSLGPINFVLEPGQSQDILAYLTIPCGAEKEYDLNIHVSTVLDTKKVLSQKIFVQKTRNIGLLPIEYSKKIKPCGMASYVFNLTNTGSFDETYLIKFQEPLGKYAHVNFNQVTLGAGQTVPLQIYIQTSCNIYGNYTVPFSVTTLNTDNYAKTFVYLLIDRDYDYSLRLGNSYAYTKNASEPSFVEHDTDEIYSFCKNSAEAIPIRIKNNADLPNSYSLKLLNSPGFFKLSTGSLNLNKSEEKSLKLIVNSSNIYGDYVAALDIMSNLGDVRKVKNISISIENCYEPDILIAKNTFAVDYNATKIPISITNTGTKTANYVLSLKSSAGWLSVEPASLSVEPGKTGKIYIVSNPSKTTPSGKYKASLQLKAGNSAYESSFNVKLSKMNMITKFYYDFILPYVWYLLAALLLLLILLALLAVAAVRNKRIRKEKKPAVKKAETKKRAEKKLTGKQKKTIGWILLILLLVLLAALIYFFWNKIPYTSYVESLFNQTKNQTAQKPTEPLKPTKSFITTLKEWFVPVKDFFMDYWLYFVIGLAALLLILILFFLFRWIKKKGIIQKIRRRRLIRQARKKAAAEKEPKKQLKIKINKKWLWILILILLLLGLGYLVYSFWGTQIASFYTNFTKSLNQTKLNFTEIKPVAPAIDITEKNMTKGPSFISSVFVKTKDFFMDYLIYFLYGIASLILLLLLFLLIRKLRKRNTIYYMVDHADKDIVLRNKKFACGEIIIKVKRLVYNIGIWLKRTKKQTFIGAGDIVYEYFELTKENLDDSDISDFIIRFRVKKSWLKRNSVKKGDLCLRRYHNRWVGVNTKLINEDKKYYYYESLLNHSEFGYFAVVGKKTEEKKVKANAEAAKRYKKINFKLFRTMFWLVIAILLILGLVFLIWYFWNNLINFLKTYLWYILGAIGFIVILLLIYLLINLLKKFWRVAKRILKWILITAIIIFLLAILGYGIYYLLSHITFDLDLGQLLVRSQNQSYSGNLTGEKLPEGFNQSMEEPQVTLEENKGIPNQEWYSNTNLTLNLGNYFSDPDGDKLYYSNSELQNINVFYNNDLVTLIPHKNWRGSEFVIFTADDMKGGIVDSNIIKLTVKSQAEPTFLFILSSYRPWNPGK